MNWIFAVFFCYFKTEWAGKNPALLIMLMMPSYCLINSKMIVSNFTKMEMQSFTLNGIYVLLFGLNQQVFGGALSEQTCAIIIFAIDGVSYLTFVFYTIGQITKFLDIYCLSIKHRKDQPLDFSNKVKGEDDGPKEEEAPPKPLNRADRRKQKGKEQQASSADSRTKTAKTRESGKARAQAQALINKQKHS